MHHIVDGEKLRGVLEELSERHESGRKAAERMGIGQSTFARLRNGTTKNAMSYDTYWSICRAFDADPHAPRRRLDRPIPDPVLEDFEVWFRARETKARELHAGDGELHADDLNSAMQSIPPDVVIEPDELDVARKDLIEERVQRALADDSLLLRFLDSIVTKDEREVRDGYEAWLDGELRWFAKRVKSVLGELMEREELRELIGNFLDAVRKEDEPESHVRRCTLALYRAVDPLVDAHDTWGVERSWRELHDVDLLLPYLRAALDREEILLRGRESELTRIRGAHPPTTHDEDVEEEEMESDSG